MRMSSEDEQPWQQPRGPCSDVAHVQVKQADLWSDFFNAPPAEPDEEPVQATEIFDRARGDHRWAPDPDGRIADERISHLLGRILRYHIDTVSLQSDEDGYVDVAELIASCPDFYHTTVEDVCRVAQESVSHRGNRFELRTAEASADDGSMIVRVGIRATYRRHTKDRRLAGTGRRHLRAALGAFTAAPPGAAALPDGECSPEGVEEQVAAFVRFRPGFSRLPDKDRADEDMPPPRPPLALPARASTTLRAAAVPASAAVAATAPAVAVPSRVHGSAGRLLGGSGARAGAAAEAAATLSREAAATREEAAAPVEEVGWERYLEPGSRRPWFWNEATDEVFFPDDKQCGWERFEAADGRPWWWQEASGRFFFCKESDNEEEEDDDELEE